MNLLIDTSVFLWICCDPKLLSVTARQALENPKNDLWVHPVSFWELQIKNQIGKLPLKIPLQEFITKGMHRHGIQESTFSSESIFFLEKLPMLHRDPFDRLLIAHALLKSWTLVTSDETIKEYPVPILW